MFRVVIIGTGVIAPMHVEAYLEFPKDVKIVALCDIYPEKAREMAGKYQLDAPIYDDHMKLLENEAVDLVYVCTPPYVHAKIAVNSLKARAQVVVEKPMAASLKECDDMNWTAEDTGQTLSVISQNRFTNDHMKLKTLLDEKIIGKILRIQVDSFWWRGNNYYDL